MCRLSYTTRYFELGVLALSGHCSNLATIHLKLLGVLLIYDVNALLLLLL